MDFTKMHGYGNAYIFMDCREHDVVNASLLSRLAADQATGIGGDGLILIYPSSLATARVEMYNADGSRMAMCGNGIRCAGRFLLSRNKAEGEPFSLSQAPKTLGLIMARTKSRLGGGPVELRSLGLETDAGVRRLYGYIQNGEARIWTLDIGPVTLQLAEMDCTLPGEVAIDREVTLGGHRFLLTVIATGNLHGVVFTPDLDEVDLPVLGPLLAGAPLFPDRANIHFVQVIAPDCLQMLTWERGSGPTRACGTGACAALVAARVTERAGPACRVVQPGGELQVDMVDRSVFLTGEARVICTGEWQPD